MVADDGRRRVCHQTVAVPSVSSQLTPSHTSCLQAGEGVTAAALRQLSESMQANPLEDRALGHTEPCMRRPVVAAPWRGEQSFSTCVLGPLDTSSSSSDAEDAARDVIVTAASTSHRHALASFVEFYLRCNLSHRLVVYDLGGGGLRSEPGVEVRVFNYSCLLYTSPSPRDS